MTAQQPFRVLVVAVDDRGIQRVTIDVDGVPLAVAAGVTGPPYYVALWNTRDRRWGPGWHTITVTAVDTAGQTTRDSLRVFLRR